MEPLSPTSFNKKLVAAISQRAQSELFSAEATKWFWFAGAISLCFLILCTAAFIVTAAYFNLNKKDDFTILAQSFEDGLKGVVLKAETSGAVNLISDPLRIRDGQFLYLDPKATISIAKNSEVTVKGDIPIILPEMKSPSPTQNVTRNAVAAPSAYFTVFKSVRYKDGRIATGWNYLTANQESPSSQYCYFDTSLSNDGSSEVLFFATNGQIDKSVNPPPGFDLQDALGRCIWHEAN